MEKNIGYPLWSFSSPFAHGRYRCAPLLTCHSTPGAMDRASDDLHSATDYRHECKVSFIAILLLAKCCFGQLAHLCHIFAVSSCTATLPYIVTTISIAIQITIYLVTRVLNDPTVSSNEKEMVASLYPSVLFLVLATGPSLSAALSFHNLLQHRNALGSRPQRSAADIRITLFIIVNVFAALCFLCGGAINLYSELSGINNRWSDAVLLVRF